MATVYAGVDTVLRRRVAIKLLRPQFAADEEFVKRFYTEAHLAAKLSHPNIVNIYDVGHEGDSYFIVMELVDGPTLAEMIEQDGRLPEPVAIDFAQQICNGLAYAHRQGLLHRDIKPANILVTRDDVVKLSDFGIARAVTTQTATLTQPGTVMGSVFYLSPEQAQGLELHETSDLYSLGIVIFQMLTGKLPYTGESPVTVALKHVSNAIPAVDADDPSIGPALVAIVRRLMQKDPRDRFASAMEVAKALREAREGLPPAEPYVAAVSGAAQREPVGSGAPPKPKPRRSRAPDHRDAHAETGSRRAAAFGAESAAAPLLRGRTLLFGIVAVLLIAVVTGYALTNRPGGLLGTRQVVLENVTGMPANDAEKALEAAGLRYAVVPVESETIPPDRVVRQDPAAQAEVAWQSVVRLYVSSGAPTVRLIDVRQYSIEDAARYLRAARLVAKITPRYDARAPKGTVLSQKPVPGATVAIHSAVALVVSQGPHPIAVPDLVTMGVADATQALAAKGLRLQIGDRVANDNIPADTILSQSPQSGADVEPGSVVMASVSAGPAPVQVPSVGGRVVDEAVGLLQSAGLDANILYVVDSSVQTGTVMNQTPAADARAKKGSAVQLDVAVPGAVPDVAGMTQQQAQLTLRNAGYKIGNTAYVQEGPDGKVARTEPAANASLRPGETVTLYVNGVSPAPP
jgi:serine/threonine-protein kinase